MVMVVVMEIAMVTGVGMGMLNLSVFLDSLILAEKQTLRGSNPNVTCRSMSRHYVAGKQVRSVNNELDSLGHFGTFGTNQKAFRRFPSFPSHFRPFSPIVWLIEKNAFRMNGRKD